MDMTLLPRSIEWFRGPEWRPSCRLRSGRAEDRSCRAHPKTMVSIAPMFRGCPGPVFGTQLPDRSQS
jgi:hypothetical protein